MEALINSVNNYTKLHLNRCRCTKCFSEYSTEVVLDSSVVTVSSSHDKPKFTKPCSKKSSEFRGTIYIKKSRVLEMGHALYFVCRKCGHFRAALMPKSASNYAKTG